MTYAAPVAIGVLMLVIMLIPVAILFFAAWEIYRKVRGAPGKLLLAGTIILAIASLDSTSIFFGTFLLDTQTMTDIIVYTSFIFEALKFIALILIGLGLINLSRTLGSGEAPE